MALDSVRAALKRVPIIAPLVLTNVPSSPLLVPVATVAPFISIQRYGAAKVARRSLVYPLIERGGSGMRKVMLREKGGGSFLKYTRVIEGHRSQETRTACRLFLSFFFPLFSFHSLTDDHDR